jgi:hypothetical protein
MTLLATLAKWELGLLLIGLGATVAVKLLNGDINTRGLLYGRISGRPAANAQYFSPERVQLLAITIMGALHYLTLVLTNPNPGTFPPIPQSLSAIVGGSNVLYLGGKAYARWLAK